MICLIESSLVARPRRKAGPVEILIIVTVVEDESKVLAVRDEAEGRGKRLDVYRSLVVQANSSVTGTSLSKDCLRSR